MTLLITILFLGSLRKRDRSGGLGIPNWCSPERGERTTRHHVRPGLCSLVPTCMVESAVLDRRVQVALSGAGYGLTQTLAAAPQMVARWENAGAAAPDAWAVLTAALDAGPCTVTELGAGPRSRQPKSS